MTMPSWDGAYAASTPAPWDIGLPQPAFVRLAEQGLLSGRVLDSGCGTGEHTLLAAAHGADATGVDVSGRAIQRARERRPNEAWWHASKSAARPSAGRLSYRFPQGLRDWWCQAGRRCPGDPAGVAGPGLT